MIKSYKLYLALWFCSFTVVATLKATTYTSIHDGSWTVSGTWDANGVPPATITPLDMVIINGHNVNMDLNVINNGIIEIANGGASFFYVDATFKLTNNLTLRTATGMDGAVIDVYGELANAGTILIQNDIGSLDIEAGAVFSNTSTITLIAGSMYIKTNVTNAGTITIGANSGLANEVETLTNNGTITNTDGYINNTGTIINNNVFTNNGYYTGTGNFMGSPFTNQALGTVGFGDINCIAFADGFSNNGAIDFTLRGHATPCTDYTQINVMGTATLNGTFSISTYSPYTPSLGNTYNVLTANEISGQFTSNSFDLGGGLYANAYYLTTMGINTSIQIKIENMAVLPVELLKFTATTEGSKNYLTWATASETNNKGFDIERSRDGATFQSIGTVKAIGKAGNYIFTDATPVNGTNYYRLRQIDFDGTETYSKVVSVANKGGKSLKVYPTLVSNGFLTVDTEGGDYAIYNIVGQQVQSGQTSQRLDVSALAKGTYILKVGTEQAKFVKQ